MLSWRDLTGSGFYSWFAVEEVGRRLGPQGATVMELKVGSYRDAVDIEVTLDSDRRVTSAGLVLDRDWVGGQFDASPFAVDITRSFLRLLAGAVHESAAVGAALWRLLESDADATIDGVVATFVGKTPRWTIDGDEGVLLFENCTMCGRERLRIAWRPAESSLRAGPTIVADHCSFHGQSGQPSTGND